MNNPALTALWDQEEMQRAEQIRRHGFALVAVAGDCDDDCPACRVDNRASRRADAQSDPIRDGMFAYTVGLFGITHPELLIFPDSQQTADHVLTSVAKRVLAGSRIVEGEIVELHVLGRHALAERVPNPGQVVFAANNYYQRPPQVSVPVLQLTLTDLKGRFPWEADYDWRPQPKPGSFAA